MRKEELINKTISLYETVGWKKWFAKIRFWDAPYVEVEKLIPKSGTITELGCGEGIFSNFMAVSSATRKIFGIDIDKDRINEADQGLKNVSFKKGDVTKVNIKPSDCIVMFHLLHHLLSRELQEKLIEKVSVSVKKDGKIIIVEVNNRPFLKYLIAWFTDHFLVAWLFEKRVYEPNIFFRSEKEWISVLKANNLRCRVHHVSSGKPFSHIIFECSKLQTR